jgi:glycosyltransferase involved in cell wall biosynthesis
VKLPVLMPVYNEAARWLKPSSRCSTSTPCAMEPVVVDDGGTDETPQILAGLQDERMVGLDPGGLRGDER